MDDELLTRYSRHILLPEIDVCGQQRLLDARALIIGLGGLGAPAAMYLASSGVGHLTLCDSDQVDLSNLQRQIIHHNKDIGRSKVASARDTLRALNPETVISTLEQHLLGAALLEQVAQADVVIDASDNFDTRFAINEACVKQHTALISGAAIGMNGQVTLFNNNSPASPCYRCLYDDQATDDSGDCSKNGVLAPLVGIIGSIMATEALKILAGFGDDLTGRLLTIDAHSMRWRTLQLSQDPHCPVCGSDNQTIHRIAARHGT